MNCKTCDKLIEQIEGKKARLFCGDSCRITYSRKMSKSEHLNPNKSNPNKPIKSEQVNPNKPKYPIGSCHACGEGAGTFNGKLCICRECIGKGITHKSLGLDIRECEK